MKVLWLVNIVFPEATYLLGEHSELKSTGGWLVSSADQLVNSGVEICVVSLSPLVKKLKLLSGCVIQYAIIPSDLHGIEDYLDEINMVFKPDVVHIHGTETLLGDVWVGRFGSQKVVVSLQGVLTAIYKYHHSGMSNWDILSNLTARDVLRKTIWGEQASYLIKSERERKLIQSIKYVIGRTTFDKAYSQSLNPDVHYFHCNESLRDDFYSGIWSYDKCVKQTIFLSQAHAPLKGLHFLLHALPFIIKKYPNTKVRIGGANIINNKTIGTRLRLTCYGKFILGIIKKYNLQGRVEFLGPLNAAQMKEELIKANVYVCPSTIENSPNSLAEAQLLGTPCVASDAGGIPDFIPSLECGFTYRYDDHVMLAYKICESFKTSSQFDNSRMREISKKRHDRNENCKTTIKIYQEILNNK